MCRRLIVVGGLPCSGKSFLLTALQEGGASRVAEALELGADVSYLHARNTRMQDISELDQVVLHFDLFARRFDSDNGLAELLACARTVTGVTAVVPIAELRTRHRLRLRRFIRSLAFTATWKTGQVWSRIRRHAGLYLLYRNEMAVSRMQDDWIAFLSARAGRQLLVDCSDAQFRLLPAEPPLDQARELQAEAPKNNR
jgi:hypothetical protein